VSPSAVSHWEAGKYVPRTELLAQIAEKLNLPERFFRTPRSQHEPAPIFWRSFAYATKSARAQCEQRFRWFQDIVRYAHHYVEFPSVSFPRLSLPSELEKVDDRALEQFAAEVRDVWQLGQGPISDVVLLLENNGAIVTRSTLGDDALDAFSQWSTVDGLPYVVLGHSKTAVRSRMDAAHELAHLLLHQAAPSKVLRTPAIHKMLETQAFRFAGAFLMPASTFLAEVWAPTLETFRVLKERWKVSIGAMIRRCYGLGFIDEGQYRRLWMNYYQRGYREKDMLDEALRPEHPRLLRRSFEVLLAEGVQTKEQVLASLPFGRCEIEELAGLSDGFLSVDEIDAPIAIRKEHTRSAVIAFPTGADQQIVHKKGDHSMGANRRIVQPRPDGSWEVRAPKAERASAVAPTQSAAIERAREILKNDGGGELTIKGENNRIRDSDTVPPGRDPNPPRDRK